MNQNYKKVLYNSAHMDSSERWVNSSLNSAKYLKESPSIKKNIPIIKDDTLRSGANTPGVIATIEKKLQIAEELESIGIKEVEAGYPWIDEHCKFMRALKNRGSKLRLGAHTRIWIPNFREEIDRAIDAGADVINFVGGADTLTGKALHPELHEKKFMDQAIEAISYSKEKAMYVGFGSADPGNLKCFHDWVIAISLAGADRIYIYDGRGWLLPETIEFLVKYARDLLGNDKEIAVHCHDDFGLATANTLSALVSGADVADVTLLSTGHRCGNAAFEQVVPALEVLYGIHTGIKLDGIKKLCELVEKSYNIKIPLNAPVVGENMFKYGGLHIRALYQGDWYLWESLRAETVGMKRSIFFGATSLQRDTNGPIGLKIAKMGLIANNLNIDKVILKVSSKIVKHGELSETEIEALIREEINDQI